MSGPFAPIPFDAEIDVAPHERAPPPELPLAPGERLWVFGYGSLIWDPGFPHEEARPALAHGWHRSFCVRSVHYRGTVERPGLVLGLARGGACQGRAFLVAEGDRAAVLDYLYRREFINGLYRPTLVKVRFPRQGQARALAMAVDVTHADCVRGLDLDEQARRIAHAVGRRGPNRDYLFNTVAHLRELGLRDRRLEQLADRVRRL